MGATTHKPTAKWFGRLVWAGMLLLCTTAVPSTRADDDDAILQKLREAVEAFGAGEADELEAWVLARSRKFIDARELAEKVVANNPDSYIGHFVLGFVHHYGEASFPRALFHHNQARAAFEKRHGTQPGSGHPWQWHARILQELAATHGDLEHHEKKLQWIQKYNELYDPDMVAEQAWPLMKLRRFEQARLVAKEGLVSGNERQTEIALNALCAIEFEAGKDGDSYHACARAVDYSRSRGSVNAVDLTNFAEAARSMFKLDEAERVLVEATEAQVAWYGNPWMELADLYTRQGRFPEALHALKQIPRYRQQRPPHVRHADRNEARRVLAAFFLVAGRAQDAVRITDKALVMPDRRAHNSRDPAQDRAIVALLDRMGRSALAEHTLEQSVAKSWPRRVLAWLEASWIRLEAWLSGRKAARLLADNDRLTGIFRIGTSDSAIMPPWMAGELVEVAGPGVVLRAAARARSSDERAGSDAYYDAFQGEAFWEQGNEAEALQRFESALSGLGSGEVLLRGRVHALAARAAWEAEQLPRSLAHFESALQQDPGVFQRLGLEVPVYITASGSEQAHELAEALADSPRFDHDERGLSLKVQAQSGKGRACLSGRTGVLGCASLKPPEKEHKELTQAWADQVHAALFAPRVDLSQADANSLDGSNRVSRQPVPELMGL